MDDSLQVMENERRCGVMKVKNGKIVEATESELYGYYLKQEFYEIMSFTDYKERCIELGTKVIEQGGEG